jgi:hypothetical protein
MTSLVVFPDATAIIIGRLADDLAAEFGETAPVLPRIPTTRPAKFVRVVRTGGPRLNLVADNPQITVESWADSDEDAHDLAQQCRTILNAMPGATVDGVAVYRVAEASGPGNLPDPDSAQSRYSQTFTVGLRGAAPVAS